jgi:hypothetical protein
MAQRTDPARASTAARCARASPRGGDRFGPHPRGSAKTRVASGRMNNGFAAFGRQMQAIGGRRTIAAGAGVAADVVAVVTAGILAGVAISIAAGTTTVSPRAWGRRRREISRDIQQGACLRKVGIAAPALAAITTVFASPSSSARRASPAGPG